MNYYIEQVRQKYWKQYLEDVTEYICKKLINPAKYKIKSKVLNFNTYLLGLAKYNNILTTSVIKKYSNELYLDIKHNYDISDDDFNDIINYMIDISKRLNKLATIDMKTINDVEIIIDISDENYKHFLKLSGLKKKDLNYYIGCLLLRYEYYGYAKVGICLSANSIYEWIKVNKYTNSALEMFAGALNSNLPNYCSLFYDIEKYFGSKGSVFLYKDISKYKIVISNPPYITNVMNRSAKLILKYLKNTNTMAIVNIPDWRSNAQQKLDNEISINKIEQVRQDSLYENYEMLRTSKYFRKVICIGNYKYKNFFDDNIASIRDNVLIIILTNNPDDKKIDSLVKFVCYF